MRLTPPAPFFTAVWAAGAPLLAWAAHFAFSYVAVAAVCTRASISGAGEPGALRWWLAAATAIAIGALAVMLWRPRSASAPQVQLVRRVCAVLSLIGVAWVGVPLSMLPLCGP